MPDWLERRATCCGIYLKDELCDGTDNDFAPPPVYCRYRNGKLGLFCIGSWNIDRISHSTSLSVISEVRCSLPIKPLLAKCALYFPLGYFIPLLCLGMHRTSRYHVLTVLGFLETFASALLTPQRFKNEGRICATL